MVRTVPLGDYHLSAISGCSSMGRQLEHLKTALGQWIDRWSRRA